MSLKAAQWTFLILVFSIPFPRPFNITFGGLILPYTDLIFPLVVVFTLIAILQKQLTTAFDRVFLLLGLYALVLTFGIFHPEASPVKLLGEYYLFTLCWIAFVHCSEPAFLKKVTVVWLAAAAFASLISIAGVALFYAGFKTEASNYLLSHLGSLPPGNYPRIQGTFANPNMLCNYLNVSLCMVLAARSMRWISNRLTGLLIAGVMIAAAFTISPGLGGLALSLALWFEFHSGNRSVQTSRALAAVGIILTGTMFAATLVSPPTGNTQRRIEIPLTEQILEPSVRVLVWQNVIERTVPHLWLGRGTGTLTADLVYTQLSGDRQVLTDAHNIYLNVMGQTGLVGLAVFVLFVIGVTLRCGFSGGPLLTALSCAFIGAFLYQGLSGSFEDARHLWILIGMLLAVSRLASTNDTLPASTEPLLHPST